MAGRAAIVVHSPTQETYIRVVAPGERKMLQGERERDF